MRRMFTALCATLLFGSAFAQAPLRDGSMQNSVARELKGRQLAPEALERLQEQRAHRARQEAARGGDGYYMAAFFDAVENSGSLPGLVRTPQWPDSLARIVDPSGDFYWFIHAMSNIFDPNSALINDLYIEDNISVTFSSGKIYEVDSFAFYFLYDRVSAPGVVDTLRVYLYGEANISEQVFNDWPSTGTNTEVAYARYNGSLRRPGSAIINTFEYLLTDADTTGEFIGRLAEAVDITIPKNSKIGAAFHFTSGQSYSLGDVLFDNNTGLPGVLNNFDLITFFEDEGIFPLSSVTDNGALNQGGLVETSIRYQTNPLGWNVTYYPSFGFGPTFSSRHVLTEHYIKPIGAHFTSGATGNPCEIQFADRSNAEGITARDWEFGDPSGSIALDVTSPTFTYPANGTYTAKLSISSAQGSFNFERSVAVTNCVSGQNELQGVKNLEVYPNPASEFLMLDIALSAAQDLEVSMFNAQGQQVQSHIIRGVQELRQAFDVSDLPAGFYQIKVQNEGRFTTRAFVIN
jgi:hypothetical protein